MDDEAKPKARHEHLERFRRLLSQLDEAQLWEVADATFTPPSLVRAWAAGTNEPDAGFQDEVLEFLKSSYGLE